MPRNTFAPSASWSDLFYDLAFVAAVVVLSTAWAVDHSMGSLLWLSIVFGLIWATWLVTNLFTGSFVDRDQAPAALDIALLTAQMACVLLVALNATGDINQADDYFGLLVVAALALCVVLGLRARRGGILVNTRSMVLVAVAALLLVASELAFSVSAGLAVVLWLVALALVGLGAWWGLRASTISSHRLSHRLGELTIIVIGETLLKIALAADEKGWKSLEPWGLVLALLIITAMWWDYFSDAVRRPPTTPRRRVAWTLTHFLLHLALIGTAVGLGKLVVGDEALRHDGGTGLLVGLPLTLAFIALSLLDLSGGHQVAPLRAGLHGGASVVLLGISGYAVASPHADPRAVVGALAVVAAVGTGFVAALPQPKAAVGRQ